MYIVLGAGLQGPAVAYALSILKPDTVVWVVESDNKRMKRAKWLLYSKLERENNIKFLQNSPDNPILDPFRAASSATVISTLTYALNEAVAKQCIDRGWNYFDLGGHVQTSEAIREYAEGKECAVMTDLGLAPGLVNILGEHACTLVTNPKSLDMFCGGLPINPYLNEINYAIVFSPEGLINEYFNDCKALRSGEVVDVEPMGDVDIAQFNGIVYECFNTSGAIHTTLEASKKLGLLDCRYKTLRYMGHSKVFRFLKHDVGMTNEQLVALVKDKVPYTTEDKVIIGIKVLGDASYIVDYEILHDDNFTAMQRATGFSAAVTILQVEDKQGFLSYSDVNGQELLKALGSDKLLPELNG